MQTPNPKARLPLDRAIKGGGHPRWLSQTRTAGQLKDTPDSEPFLPLSI